MRVYTGLGKDKRCTYVKSICKHKTVTLSQQLDQFHFTCLYFFKKKFLVSCSFLEFINVAVLTLQFVTISGRFYVPNQSVGAK